VEKTKTPIFYFSVYTIVCIIGEGGERFFLFIKIAILVLKNLKVLISYSHDDNFIP